MIAELYRRLIDLGARALVRAGLHANQVTFLALVIGLAACVGFVMTGARVAFAVALLVGGYLDALDGAVARLRRAETRVGGYLDALGDRVFDAAVLFTLALASGHWALCMLVAVASFAASYVKARAALEAPVSNDGWPHLMGREERVVTLVLTIALWGILPTFAIGGLDVLELGLLVILTGLVVTTGQRMAHALRILGAANLKTPSA